MHFFRALPWFKLTDGRQTLYGEISPSPGSQSLRIDLSQLTTTRSQLSITLSQENVESLRDWLLRAYPLNGGTTDAAEEVTAEGSTELGNVISLHSRRKGNPGPGPGRPS